MQNINSESQKKKLNLVRRNKDFEHSSLLLAPARDKLPFLVDRRAWHQISARGVAWPRVNMRQERNSRGYRKTRDFSWSIALKSTQISFHNFNKPNFVSSKKFPLPDKEIFLSPGYSSRHLHPCNIVLNEPGRRSCNVSHPISTQHFVWRTMFNRLTSSSSYSMLNEKVWKFNRSFIQRKSSHDFYNSFESSPIQFWRSNISFAFYHSL